MSDWKLTPEQLNAFDKNGFLFMPRLFTGFEIAQISQAISNLAQIPPADCVGKQMVYFEDSVVAGQGKVLARIEKFVEYDALLSQVASDPRLVVALDQLMKDVPILFKEKINFKLPGGQGFAPHQDIQPGWDTYADYFISILVTIDPSTVENGCLELAAGHHKAGMIGERWKPLSEEQVDGMEFLSFPTEPGDVLFFDCFTPHQSAPNLTDEPRRNLYLTYNRQSTGDHRLQYYDDKRKAYPPDFERNPELVYEFKV